MNADDMLALAEQGVRIAKQLGADEAEVFLSRTRSLSINTVGDFAHPARANDLGLSVRVQVGARLGQSGALGYGEGMLERVSRHALEAARLAPDSHRFRGFVPATPVDGAPTRVHPLVREPAEERIAETVERLSGLLAGGKEVTYRGARVIALHQSFAVANSLGHAAWDESGYERLSFEARLTRGAIERSMTEAVYAPEPVAAKTNLEQLVTDALERGRAALEPKPIGRAADEIILSGAPASQLVQLLVPAFSASRAQAQQSPLAGRIGEVAYSPLLKLRDAPRGPGGVHQQRVDHEGAPTRDVSFVEQGRVQGFYYDQQAALAEGRPSTGHGLRTSVTGGVGSRTINVEMDAGRDALPQIIARTERAVLVDEAMMGGFVANATTGDFSLVAPFAFLVENGRITHALPPVTVGGNVHRVFRELRDVSRERRALRSGTYPALRAGGVSCAA